MEVELGFRLNQNIDIFTFVSGKYGMTTFSNAHYFGQSKLKHILLSLSIGLKYKMTKD